MSALLSLQVDEKRAAQSLLRHARVFMGLCCYCSPEPSQAGDASLDLFTAAMGLRKLLRNALPPTWATGDSWQAAAIIGFPNEAQRRALGVAADSDLSLVGTACRYVREGNAQQQEAGKLIVKGLATMAPRAFLKNPLLCDLCFGAKAVPSVAVDVQDALKACQEERPTLPEGPTGSVGPLAPAPR